METLIRVEELSACLDSGACVVFDCRYSLSDPKAGREAYGKGHIPGARFIDTSHDLSSLHLPGLTGRHPLPSRQEWLRKVAAWGLRPERQAVMYDDTGGAFAARLWWMLRWIGHEKAAVLDGGWQAWLGAGLPVSDQGPAKVDSAGYDYSALAPLTRTVEAESIDGARQVLLDARDGRRYRGEAEPIDPVAGHIPGARSSPFSENLREDGHFKSPAELRRKFAAAGAGEDREVVSYCGSGVTAAHNILAMKHAGLPEALLYPGSWSEWITDPARGVATGDE